ncbi:MAG: HAD family hydrolase [Alphaproteobacteria bacterium]|nr:HAD family hydrolase [Alphaproteobacteria bacterium]
MAATGTTLVVFDFDGTLADTRVGVSTCLNAALHAHGLPRVMPSFVHALMGLPLPTVFQRTLPPPQRDTDVTPLVAWYRHHFLDLALPHVAPCPGAHATLDALARRGVTTGIATSRGRTSLVPLLDHLGLGGFAVVGTDDDVDVGKPDPALLRLVLDRAGVPTEAAVMVGDTSYDVLMARAAGVRVVGVPGCHDGAALAAAGADHVVDHLEDVLPLVGG